ncbi:MAG: aldo/keto reductase [Gammaproteobacteria bacterium]
MKYRRMGRSGLQLSALSFGSWVTFSYQVDVDDALECLRIAYDTGVNFFDNAETYAQGRSELIMGKAFKKLGWSRDSFCVSSKVYFGSVADPKPTQRGLHRKHIFEACDQALQRLQVDYLDLYFCHRPDPDTHIVETVQAMSDLVRQGKVFYWGTSEWSSIQLEAAYSITEKFGLVPPSMEQPQYNMFERKKVEREFVPLFAQHGLGTTTWSPLASGVLTGKYAHGIPDGSRMAVKGYEWLRESLESDEGKRRIQVVEALRGVAHELDTSLAKLAIAWCLRNPHVSTVILGASRAEQLQENLGALDVVERLDDAVLHRIDQILSG